MNSYLGLFCPSSRYVQCISHNAYILVAVHDLSFRDGAKQAFELTMRNIGQAISLAPMSPFVCQSANVSALRPILMRAQVAVLTAGERLLLTLAKLAVSCICTALASLAITMQTGDWGALDNANGALVFIFIATFCAAVSPGHACPIQV